MLLLLGFLLFSFGLLVIKLLLIIRVPIIVLLSVVVARLLKGAERLLVLLVLRCSFFLVGWGRDVFNVAQVLHVLVPVLIRLLLIDTLHLLTDRIQGDAGQGAVQAMA